jgi:hypothetical protein
MSTPIPDLVGEYLYEKSFKFFHSRDARIVFSVAYPSHVPRVKPGRLRDLPDLEPP